MEEAMKKLKHITRSVCCYSVATCFVATLLLTACSPETENLFGESAAIRLQKSVVNYTTTLEDNAQGWSMDFYPGERIDGGVAYTARFKDGNVTLSCERAIDYGDLIYKSEYKYTAGQEVTSGYSIKSENSVVLSFDTFNALIHYWAQPFGLKAAGYASDYEFSFIHCSADSVVLRGKKYGNLMRLYPLNQSASDYITKAGAMRQQLSEIPRQRIVVDGQTQLISFTDNHLKYTDGDKQYDVPFTYTADGIRFYESASIKGMVFNQMSYDAATQELRTADGHFVLPAPSVTEKFVATKYQWYFGYTKKDGTSDMCDDLTTVVNTMVSNFKADYGGYDVLQDFYMGTNILAADKDANRVVIGWHYRPNYGYGSHEYFAYGIAMTAASPDQPLVNIQPTEAGTGFDQKSFCKTLVNWIADNSPYLASFDDEDNPTQVTLTSQKDATKWFKLKKK